MLEYIIHGTGDEHIESILSDGYISTNIDGKHSTFLEKSNFIFTQLVYRNIPNEQSHIPFYGAYALVLDKKILKDLPFYAGHIACFESIKQDGSYNTDDIYLHKKGKLKRMPRLNPLKNKIEDYAKENIFLYSHEILFTKNISLKKYCIAILFKGELKNIPPKIINKANELKIPIKIYTINNKGSFLGINRCIDVIED